MRGYPRCADLCRPYYPCQASRHRGGVRFLVGAQLPKRLASGLVGAGHDAIHTLNLSRANRTPDDDICRVADEENRIVVTKDGDFMYSFFVQARTAQLLSINSPDLRCFGALIWSGYAVVNPTYKLRCWQKLPTVTMENDA